MDIILTFSMLDYRRTCSYLLGNKGCHSYNGNTSEQTQEVISEVAESVGQISIKQDSLETTGTCFRVGDNYIMTAYHLLSDKISCLLNEVAYALDVTTGIRFQKVASKLKLQFTKTEQEPYRRATERMLNTFLLNTAMDVPLLVSKLKLLLDEDKLKALDENWKKNCRVTFLSDGVFYLDWKIEFGDEENDIVIVKLRKTDDCQNFPKPLNVDENYSHHENVCAVKYCQSASNNVFDQDIVVFKCDEDVQRQVQEAIFWWEKVLPNVKKEYFQRQYSSCSKAVDKYTGNVVLRMLNSFDFTLSGSPILYTSKDNSRPVVCMMLRRGYPLFYYKAQETIVSVDTTIEKCYINDKYLFQGGLTMEKVANLLEEHEKHDLKRKVFKGLDSKKKGTFKFTPEALTVLGSNIVESVGCITINQALYQTTGTGFRVGDKYFMTTFHVLSDKISCLLETIVYALNVSSEIDFQKVSLILNITTGKDKNDSWPKATKRLLNEFMHKTAMDTFLLLERLGDLIDKDTLIKDLKETWEEKIIVNFLLHGSFHLDWKIQFGDEESDVLVLMLLKTTDVQSFPKPLRLDKHCRHHRNIYIVRYSHDNKPTVILDPDTVVLQNDEDVQKNIQEAVAWWEKQFPKASTKYFCEQYSACSKALNKNTGHVLLKAFKAFNFKSSGSPIVYVSKYGPIVSMIYQRGYPEFYYKAEGSFAEFDLAIRECQVVNEHLFEGGTTMNKVSEMLQKYGKSDLVDNIFHQYLEMKENIWECEFIQERDERCYKYTNFYILKAMRDQDSHVTNLSECLKRGFGVIMIGKGKERLTKRNICKLIEKERVVACIVLQSSNQVVTKRRLQINVPCTTYWALEADGHDSNTSISATHFTPIVYDLYQGMIEHITGEHSTEFKEYKDFVEKQLQVQVALKTFHKHVLTYAGRHTDMNEPVIIATVFEKERNYDDKTHSIIEECNVQINYDGDSEENRAVRQYMFKHNDIDLSKESKHSIQIVIDKNMNYLMRAHINLNAIKGSAIRSQKNGSKIEKEECIVLYCTGKGHIPLLEQPFPKALNGYTTDVREGYFRLGSKYEKTLAMGLSIQCKESSLQGSIGPFVHEQDSRGNKIPCFLTCSHVCIDQQKLKLCPNLKPLPTPKHSIYQPTLEPKATTYCGEVTDIYFGNVMVNGTIIGVDVASVRMLNEDRIPNNARFAEIGNKGTREANEYVQFPKIGEVIQDITSGVGNRVVFKCGGSTGFTWGKFCKDEINFKIPYASGNFGNLMHQYEIISQDNNLFSGGDSGSAVFVKNDKNEFCLIGIAIGSDNSGGQYVMTPISAVMEALGSKWEINYFSTESMQ